MPNTAPKASAPTIATISLAGIEAHRRAAGHLDALEVVHHPRDTEDGDDRPHDRADHAKAMSPPPIR